MTPSAGQQLQQARQARGVTIEEAALATHIRAYYLRALEANDMSGLPSVVQGRGFLRNYAAYLGLDFQALTGQNQPDIPVITAAESVLSEPASDGSQAPEAAPALAGTLASIPEAPGRKVRAAPPPPTPASLPTPLADASFREIGAILREQREKLSLPLAEIERYTHIRQHYLQAMESGDFSLLPSFTQARGMLTHYARFLSLDTDRVLNGFAEALLARRQEISGPLPDRKEPPARNAGRLHRFLTMDALVGSGLVILLVILVIWGASHVFDLRQAPGVENTPPSVAEMLLASPELAFATETESALTPGPAETGQPALDTTPAPPAATGATAMPALEPGKIQVFVIALNRVWMQVSVDGQVAFTGRVEPGGAYPFTANDRIELVTGNAGGLQVYLNQDDLGSPGAWNEFVHLVYTAEGALRPTPTITPTPTRTVRPSATTTATRTPAGPGG